MLTKTTTIFDGNLTYNIIIVYGTLKFSKTSEKNHWQ